MFTDVRTPSSKVGIVMKDRRILISDNSGVGNGFLHKKREQ